MAFVWHAEGWTRETTQAYLFLNVQCLRCLRCLLLAHLLNPFSLGLPRKPTLVLCTLFCTLLFTLLCTLLCTLCTLIELLSRSASSLALILALNSSYPVFPDVYSASGLDWNGCRFVDMLT